jgi:hypothetical protein
VPGIADDLTFVSTRAVPTGTHFRRGMPVAVINAKSFKPGVD